MMLADMGADVIVVERRVANANAAVSMSEASAKHTYYNRGKRSIALDLKKPEAAEVVLSLLASADLFIEGFRPGVMERLGLGPDICLNRNPRLIYGRMTGWGQTGPLAHAAGHDPNYIALSGALWPGGSKDRVPAAPLTLVGDIGGGSMMLLFGLLSALVHAQRTGEGQVIDAAMTDGSAYLASLLRMMHNTGQLSDEPATGWADFGSPWHDTYTCADGKHITICPLEPNFYVECMKLLGLEGDPVFANQWDTAQWPAGKEKLRALFLERTREEWCALLEGTDACFAPVLNMTEATQHPHNVARETFLNIDGIVQPAPAPKMSATPQEVGACPIPGQHTVDVLADIGLDVDALTASEVI
jgi:crotonobetainyl-CoA:carnitine CoA-transferase CaiB-like acyl-CoA transferase